MKRFIFSAVMAFALLASLSVVAQNVAINATGASADPSAMLDVNATNAGLLVPRVTLASLNDGATIVSPATSLLVYNTGGSLLAGYYYNSGTPGAPVWTMLSTGSGSYWASLDGTNIYNTNTGEVNIGANTALSNGLVNVYGSVQGTFGVTYYQTPVTGTGSYNGFAIGEDNYTDGTVDLLNFANAPINIWTNSTPAATILGNGNVGVGTATPAAKTEITAFGQTNNIYTIASGYDLVTGSATYEADSTPANEQVAAYAFADGSSLENESFLGEAGSTAGYNFGVYGRVSFTPASTLSLSSAIFGYDAVGASNTYAGYLYGKVLTIGNTSIFGSSPSIEPSAYWIGFDASAYSSNNAADDSVSDAGVLGYATGSTSNLNSGVVGIGGSNAAILNVGITGLAADGTPGTNVGVLGNVGSGADYAGLFQGGNVSVYGNSAPIQPSSDFFALDIATYSSNTSGDDSVSEAGVVGFADGNTSLTNAGVIGFGGSTALFNVGTMGLADGGPAGTNIGVYGEADNSSDYAGEFYGNVYVSGTFNASGTKNFQIDHPLDPANKILRHAAIESNEVLDMYSGNITTDANGYATVRLPDYFETINKDFRYQLTVMGTFAQAIIKQKISSNQFIIQTNQPNVEVSWQVAGVRNDKEMQAHPFVAEETKTGRQAGKYFQPELYGQPASAGIVYMPKPNGKLAARRPLPSLKAVAGAAHKSANSVKPVLNSSKGSALSNNGVNKPSTVKKAAPVYPANSLMGKAAQAKAAAGSTSMPKK